MPKVKCGTCGVAGGHKISCTTLRREQPEQQQHQDPSPTIEQIALVAQYTCMSASEVKAVAETSPATFAIALSTIERRLARAVDEDGDRLTPSNEVRPTTSGLITWGTA